VETETVGRVETEATIENLKDLREVQRGLPLGHLDFVVDVRSRQLIGNPAHGGELVYEMY
jgi:hypothetical protein